MKVKLNKPNQWYEWYAWYPVRTIDGYLVFMESVYRREAKIFDVEGDYWGYEYSTTE